MIIIDGQKSDFNITNFTNLDELLVGLMSMEHLDNRIVTDVLVNDEAFSEIYPHQAEDVDCRDIQKVEIKTMGVPEMGVNIARELYKVIRLMSEGSKQIADLFRRADDAEALEMYQDLLDVTRDFLTMIGALRDEFSLTKNPQFETAVNELSELFTEMMEVQENEDWILLSDLLEYEFHPLVERWKSIVAQLREDVRKSIREN
ncbi:hypothetical protein SAMN05660653_01875 [Desulfonatronum thiosulfatophilum]|uniref:Uncharacterized protein n=1 Tax=Desulfonatronum thiosulfatophilum TaxID=617002 RepID=A0A1G6D3H1_9BACT|nr:hypothetical protein [Desulfonatronum thiosulfatophilum]SDB39495.1 hypothetical protein SAMN05660653_01875 [Desulfonatronum thiosulfatophilum]